MLYKEHHTTVSLPHHLQEAKVEKDMHAREVYNSLVNLEFLLDLLVMLPLLRSLNSLVKVLQTRELYLQDAITAIRDTQTAIAERYLSRQKSFTGSPFGVFNNIGKVTDGICMEGCWLLS